MANTDYYTSIANCKLSTNVITSIDDCLSRKDGGTISSSIGVSVNFDVGLGNTIVGQQQFASGIGNVVGSKSILIIAVDKQTSSLSCRYSGDLESIKQIEGHTFVTYSQGSQGLGSIVESVAQTSDSNVYEIKVSKWYPILDNAANRCYLTVPNMPQFGDSITSSAKNAMAIGDGSIAIGYCANALGYQTSAIGNYAHAEGHSTFASWGAHSECDQTYAERPGSHAEGRQAHAEGYAAHVEGHSTSALGHFSHASGVKANAVDNCSYVWNGKNVGDNGSQFINWSQNSMISSSSVSEYSSHGTGTFNINPLDGVDGVFIGEKPMTALFASLDSNQKMPTRNMPTVGDVPEGFNYSIAMNQLQYIENLDAAFFIDSGIQVQQLNNAQTELTFSFSNNGIRYGGIFGYRVSAGQDNNYGIQVNSDNNNNLYITPGSSIDRLQVAMDSNLYKSIIDVKFKGVMSKNIRQLFDIDAGRLLGQKDSVVSVEFDSTETCYIFGFNGNSMTGKSFIGKIYGIKIDSIDGQPMYHLVPYYDRSNGDVGFFDLVANAWVYKQAQSDAFRGGPFMYDAYQLEMFKLKQQIQELSALIANRE